MLPTRLYLPRVRESTSSEAGLRDIERLKLEWHGAQRVYIDPDAQESKEWLDDRGRTIQVIPGEQLNIVDVYFIDKHYNVAGPNAERVFPDCSVQSLLPLFLAASEKSLVSLVRAFSPIRAVVPFIGGTEGFKEYFVEAPEIDLPPATPMDEKQHRVVFNLSGENAELLISPDAESRRRLQPSPLFGRASVKWRDRLSQLFLYGGYSGSDSLHILAKMNGIIELSKGDMDEAQRQALIWADRYVSSASDIKAFTWLMPLHYSKGESAVLVDLMGLPLDEEAKDSATLGQAMKKESFQSFLLEKESTRIAWGAVGLFWTLLLDLFEQGRTLKRCENCGFYIPSAGGRKFCHSEDNGACFKARAAKRQRQHRSKTST